MKPPGHSTLDALSRNDDFRPALKCGGRRGRETAHRLGGAAILCACLLRAAEPGAASEPYDRLQLVSGEVVAGVVQNQPFVLRTSYARLEFAIADLERIEVERPPDNLTILHTSNRDRLSGFLENPAIELETTNGESRIFRRERIQTLLLAPRPASASLTEGSREPNRFLRGESAEVAMTLRNGDLLKGSLSAGSLGLLQTGGSRSEVDLAEVAFMTFTDRPETQVGIRLLSGGTVEGALVPEEITVTLRCGVVIPVYRGRIQLIDRRRGAVAPGSGGGAGPADAFVWVPPGEVLLGSPSSEAGRDLDEGPSTPVSIPRGFWLGRYEVSQAEYQAVMGRNPSQYSGFPDYPVEKVSWEDAVAYCQRLTRLHRDAGAIPDSYEYRLPTEAEWEYACRAGSTTAYSHGDDRDGAGLPDYAWFTNNSDSSPHGVGGKRANPWGLHDMHGNVWEWCLDRWTDTDRGARRTDQVIAATGHLRVARGGSWLYSALHARSANRDEYAADNRCSDVGFRVVLAITPSPFP